MGRYVFAHKVNNMSYTLLESINYVISQTGAAPVDNVNDPLPDVASATLRIREAQIQTLKRGWWFNTDLCLKITKSVSDTYTIPADTIKILRASPYFVIDRGGLAYDPYSQSTIFPEGPETLVIDRVYNMPYEDLPYSAQDVIRLVAARAHILIDLEDTRKAQSLDLEIDAALIDMRKDDLQIQRHTSVWNPTFIKTRGGVRPYRSGGRTVNPTIPGG